MEKIIPYLKIFTYWLVAAITSAVLITWFSCLYPRENFDYYFGIGQYFGAFKYLMMTLNLYLFLHFMVAFVGVPANFILYYFYRSRKFLRIKLLLFNLTWVILCLCGYYLLEITPVEKFLRFIVPSVLASFTVWAFIFPSKKTL